MLVEIWRGGAGEMDSEFDPADPATYPRGVRIYLPADTDCWPGHCFAVADADWRYLARFAGPPHRTEAAYLPRTKFAQDRYDFETAAARDVLAGAAPYAEAADAH